MGDDDSMQQRERSKNDRVEESLFLMARCWKLLEQLAPSDALFYYGVSDLICTILCTSSPLRIVIYLYYSQISRLTNPETLQSESEYS